MSLIKRIVFSFYVRGPSRSKVKRITKHLKKTDNILDIGSGYGAVSWLLRKQGYKVTPLDVKNKSCTKEIRPIIYNGRKIPFKDKSFDVALLITVLHHTKNPEEVLKEARRVAKRLIVMEETYSNIFQKYVTFIIDSLVNFEFLGHPHTNKTDAEWRRTFRNMGLEVCDVNKKRQLVFLEQVTYFLR
ncbi:class I SAM-dependent methyltransferase [Candidatus Woesearchaeota archaeon]|nr:MAG: class I SAM-dependent methyltransferase [Candidatus Woesearchaeota archaeon]